ncbi:polysaccharide deacetylase family protein [Coraliomargarita algicola]|uniref:Polysaccharide deacetylase family protein n=1 Tax=Coraliomargarita algicola TaxID=3092156 RepID=A0ABZ0RKN3_9BACT|nr:polysaccharide deacetylase family protein [Coraliomargarita sp. J2-16]WPJ96765.1 polysaccharide deacetylase family protein [Coraliomargarita sp. J2-16]
MKIINQSRTVAQLALLFLTAGSVLAEVPEIRICEYHDNKDAAISLTFDDGLLDHATVVQPMLKESGIRATFFIVPKYTDMALKQRAHPSKRQFASWEQIRSIAADGHEMGNHSSTHANLKNASEELLQHEVVDALSYIEAQTGQRPQTFCFSGNSRDQRALEFVLQHHVNARTYQYGIGRNFEIDRFSAWLTGQIQKRQWSVLMIHSILDDYNGYDPLPDEEKDFQDLLDQLNDCRDDLWIDTFAAVSKYVALRDSASIQLLNGGTQYVVKSDLDAAVYDVPLTVEVRQGEQSIYQSVSINEVIDLPQAGAQR